MKEEVFISYAWITSTNGKKSHTDIVDSIAKKLKKDFTVVLDKKDLKYKGNIKEFEKRLGNGNKIVLVVSDKFLKSKHCMFEVLKIVEKGNVYDRIFPVVMLDADIYNAKGILKYTKHWENEAALLNRELKKSKSQAHLKPLHEEISHYTKFREIIADFIHLLSNMNTLKPEIHEETNFKDLINALYGNTPRPDTKLERDFSNQISKTKKHFEKAVEIISREIKEEKVKAEEILERVKHFQQQCKDQTFQIAVMAILKSGKSTFLNSLLGNEFLPMSNVAETSVPVKINHSENGKGELTFGKSKIAGANKIRKHIETTNKERRDKGYKQEVEFTLNASFKVLEEKEMTDIKFEILDTPGFAEAATEITIGKTFDQSNSELINKISSIIYLLDYTKLKTKDENEVLEKLADLRPDMLEKISDRLFFVINKIDEEDRNSLPPDEVVDYVFNLVKQKVPKILKQHFFTISASRALLSRLILTDNATSEAKKDFGKIAFGFRANQKDDAEYKELANEILISSQIMEVENKIINYIFENRSRIFIESLQDNLKRLLQEFKNQFVVTAEGVLSRTIEEIEDLEAKIEEAKKKQQNIQDEAEKFETEMRDWIEKEFRTFENTIIDQIESAFNYEKEEDKQSLLGRITPNWVKRIHKALTQVEEQLKHTPKFQIENSIRNLNIEINQELLNSFNEFRKQLEGKLAQKQTLLFTNLKQTIDSLAKDFESTLKKGLHIEFDSYGVRFEEPDFDRTLMEADALIDRFVKTDFKIVKVKKQGQVYSKRANCFLGGYRTITFYEDEMFAENKISKASLEIFWRKIIQERYQNAKDFTNRLLENNIKSQIRNARNSFNNYVGAYLATIQEKKVKLSTGSKEEIEEQICRLRKTNENVTAIISELK
ncbi:MAG: dynamin family protein [Flavobacteriales bacterium]|nr:dynamin family protein [Flavobacteriales bacterium]